MAIAKTYGGDWSFNATPEATDIEANQQGIDNADKNGRTVSCEETCRKQFMDKFKAECCPVTGLTTLRKNDTNCCESSRSKFMDFVNAASGGTH